MGHPWGEGVIRVLDRVGLRMGHAWWFQREEPAPPPHNGKVKNICFKVGQVWQWLGTKGCVLLGVGGNIPC